MTTDLSKPFFVTIGPRGVVRVAGPDRHAFLQAIVSNDLALLETQDAVYSCLLSAQGKFLHDFFVREDGETLALECEPGTRATDLMAKLRLYKLRSKVELTVEPDCEFYSLLSPQEAVPLQEGQGYIDPRNSSLGWRTTIKQENLEEKPRAIWDTIRIRLGFPDGSRDMEVGKDTLLDCNIDRAHGLSHAKGCYVGQEITARMNLRGLVKKRLRPVAGAALPAPFTDITMDGQLAGQMRGVSGDTGLAMIRDDMLDVLRNADSPIKLLEETS